MSSTLPQLPDPTKLLHPNDVLAVPPAKIDGPPTFHRILWVSYSDRRIVFMDLVEDDELREPYFQDLSVVESKLNSGYYYKSKFVLPEFMLLADSDIPPKNKDHRDRSWVMIQTLINPSMEPSIFLRARRGPLITRIAAAHGKTRRAILSLLYRTYKYGSIPNSVLPKWPNCGGPGKSREPGEAKRGRTPKVVVTGHAPERVGLNIDSDLRRKILLGVDTFCGTDDRMSIAKAYRATKDRYFVQLFEKSDGSLVTVPMPANSVPTEGQFRYYAQKRLSNLAFARRRQGERQYLQSARALPGTARSGLLGPGHLYEIDSTIADIYLVSRYNPEWVIGRPVIYVVIDTFSRLIVGMYVGLIGPSWAGARMAIANALSNKVAYCARHGKTIADSDWPAHHFPYAIAADRAEMLCIAAERAINDLGIELATPGPYRPDWKGTVERRFGLINTGAIDWLPGAVRQRQRDVRKRGYVLDATLNIDEFTRIIINCVLEHNLCVQREDLLTKEMITAGVMPYSIDMWNWGVSNLTGPLRSEDGDLVRTHLLPSAAATVTERGILCNGLLYSTERALAEGWFERARRTKSWSVSAKTEYFTDTIYLAPPTVKQFEVCQLLDPETRYANMRIEEAIDCLEFLRLSGTDFADRDERLRHGYQTESNSVIKAAIERKRQHHKSSTAQSRTKQIRAQRVLEQEAERVIESRDGASRAAKILSLPKVSRPAAATQTSGVPADVIALLRDQRNKRWEPPK